MVRMKMLDDRNENGCVETRLMKVDGRMFGLELKLLYTLQGQCGNAMAISNHVGCRA